MPGRFGIGEFGPCAYEFADFLCAAGQKLWQVLPLNPNNEALVSSIMFFPPAEAIQEFRVNTSVAPAEFGRAGGAIMQTQIKSGTNQIHGSGFIFDQQSAYNAHSYNNPLSPQHRNQFGGTIGAPIWKNKLFVFLYYQGPRQKSPVGTEYTFVPTAKQHTGDFSELLLPANTSGTYTRRDTGYVYPGSTSMATMPVPQVCPSLYSGGVPLAAFANMGYIYDPQTCLPFGWNGSVGTNIIPAASQNAAGMNLINAYPAPNIAGAAITDYNFAANRKFIRNRPLRSKGWSIRTLHRASILPLSTDGSQAGCPI